MGWREREYARFNDAERRVFYGADASRAAPRSRSFFKPGVGLAILVSAALFLVGHYPRGHALVPALGIKLPSLPGARRSSSPTGAAVEIPSRSFPLHGPRTARFRSTLTLYGSDPSAAGGSIRVEGHWNARPWQILTSTKLAPDHRWRASILMDHHGMLNLRVILPDGNRLAGSVRVTS